ncbi:cadherin domain-containing protein [Dongia rigui]|uniref:Cadherin domain-containing protein n=1 Tax=Dongia rigui TaxID=940149 RepID=A0ABU5E4G9_9PROT|nr:cadherin domain-containing protein [Dongia rigui]MDY0874496.1 cadherin domain-containing protein [Dongia rigui]
MTNLAPISLVDNDVTANSVAENASSGTVVGVTALASDPDIGDALTYVLSDDAGGRFQIDASTGVVTVANGALLDYEAATSHSITVVATDSGGLTTSDTFSISLTNINEAPATITDDNASVNAVSENAGNGTVVGVTALASDPDAGDTVVYSLSDDAGGRFQIDPLTGVVTVANGSALDFEAAASHSVTVVATDAGGLTKSETFNITITDVNEAPASLIDSQSATNSVDENAATGTTVGITALASDPDTGDTLTYFLSDDAGGRFQIDATTGAVTVANGTLLDHESAASHSITIVATDSGGLTKSETFSIAVTNVNETPLSLVDANAAPNSVSENAASGTVVGITALASDPDISDTLTYSLSDNAGGRFQINATTGVVTVANGALLNYEAAGSHSITVIATDSGGLTHSETFNIAVTDVNEAPASLSDSNPAANSVAENSVTGTVVGITALASDPDAGDSVTYSLSNSAGGRFQIDANTGVVTVANGALLNYEAATSYNITIVATDTGGLTRSQTVAVGVTNVNEAPVSIIDAHSSLNHVEEYAETGTIVGVTALASDPDAGDTLSYSLSDDAGGRFQIDSVTGVVTVADGTLLDYRVNTTHSITVVATDAGGLSKSQSFTIDLLPMNNKVTVANGVLNPTAVTNSAQGLTSTIVTLTTENQLVVWSTPTSLLKGRFLNPVGQPEGGEFDLGSSPGNAVAVAALSDGQFVIARQSGSGLSVQRYDAAGGALGTPWTQTNGNPPSITTLADGSYVVTWHATGIDLNGYGVAGQRFAANGSTIGSIFQINTVTSDHQFQPDIAALSGGGFAIAWTDNSTGQNEIRGRIYSASGLPLSGADFLVNSGRSDSQTFPSVAGLIDGGLIVVWVSDNGQDGDQRGVYARRYNSAGVAVGGEFLVNSITAGSQDQSQVVALTDGGFVVTWRSENAIMARRYSSGGAAIGAEFEVTSFGSNPTITALANGGFSISYKGSLDVLVRQYGPVTTDYSGRSGLVGGAGDDVLEGKAGNDILIGGLGNDTLKGGPGYDVAIFSGRAIDYSISNLGNGHIRVTDLRTLNNEGSDILTSIDEIRYLGDLPVLSAGSANIVTSSLAGSSSSITTLSDGRQLVVWGAYNSQLRGRFLNAAGQGLGSEFGLGGVAKLPVTVAALPDGGFLIVRETGGAISVQRYDSAGLTSGSAWSRLNGNLPSIAVLSDGSYVATWHATGIDVSGYAIGGQRFAADGAPIGDMFRINTASIDHQFQSHVVALANGGFMVVWTDVSAGQTDVRGQPFDTLGKQLGGGDFIINSGRTDAQERSSIAALSDGGFIAVWESSPGQDGDGVGVYGRRFTSQGVAVGSEFMVNTVASNSQSRPQVAGLADGGYVVVWNSGTGSSSGQRYDATGAKLGAEFQIAAIADDPFVTALPGGGFTVTYRSSSVEISSITYSDGQTLAGDDAGNNLVGSAANQYLSGAGGNDTLDGAGGNDILIGGAGNDTLIGGAGADEFRFGRGGEADTIDAHDTDGGADKLAILTGVSADQLWFTQSGNDLIVSMIGTNDRATIQGWYSSADNKLDRIQLADGRYASASDVEQLRSAMAAFSPPPLGQLNLDPTTKQSLQPTLAAAWH